jgi:hypothetical protein
MPYPPHGNVLFGMKPEMDMLSNEMSNISVSSEYTEVKHSEMTEVEKYVGVDVETLYDRMREMEVDTMEPYECRIMKVKNRRELVDWLSELGDKLQLDTVTVHVGVAYMDIILQSTPFAREQRQLVAICCLFLAAKFEGVDDLVPDMHDLAHRVQADVEDLIHMEMLLLTRMRWNLRVITHAHILGLFVAKGVLFRDDTHTAMIAYDEMNERVAGFCNFFSEICLQGTSTDSIDSLSHSLRPSSFVCVCYFLPSRESCFSPPPTLQTDASECLCLQSLRLPSSVPLGECCGYLLYGGLS